MCKTITVLSVLFAVAVLANPTPECWGDEEAFVREMPKLLQQVEQYGDKLVGLQDKIRAAAAESGIPMPIPTVDFKDPTSIILAPVANSAQLVVDFHEQITDSSLRMLRAQMDTAQWIVDQNIEMMSTLNNQINTANQMLADVNAALAEAATEQLRTLHDNLTDAVETLNETIADWSGVSTVADAVEDVFDDWF